MKKLLALLLLLAFPAQAQPTTPFPAFVTGQNPTSLPLGAGDLVPVIQGGVTTKLARPWTSINGTTCYLTDSCTVAIAPGSIALTDTHILVGNASNLAADVAISGAFAITNLGVTSLNANAVTTAAIANAQVTYAKLQNEATVTLLGNPTGSPAAPSEITLGSGLSFSGTTLVATGSGGTVTSVGLSVPATSIFGATGTPVTTSGTLGLTTTGTSGGIPYFSSTSQLASSALLTANAITLGGGAGAAPVSLGSLGTTTTLLHGNASGAPTFGSVANADLTNASTTVNGQTCTLGSTCTVTAAATGITVGTTTIGSGTTTQFLYDNAGVLGNQTAVTSIACGTGLSGGTVTTTGTCTLDLTHVNAWTGAQTFAEVHGGLPEVVALTSNDYVAVAADCGKIKYLPTGTTPTVHLPNLNVGCTIVFVTSVAKSYQFLAASGGSTINSQGFSHSRGTNAGDTISATIVVNSVSAATWNIAGDLTS
jgi:hypothetical protein